MPEAGRADAGLLLERSREIERFDRALDALVDGAGSVIVVDAPAGLGKTALLAAAEARATKRGAQVLRARGDEL